MRVLKYICILNSSKHEQRETNNKLQTTSKPTSTSTLTPSMSLGPIPTLQFKAGLRIALWKLLRIAMWKLDLRPCSA